MPICKLCRCEKQLIKKSHIISEFMYDLLKDDKGKIITFTPADLVNPNRYVKRIPTGIYEGGLMCAKCENEILGKYESYAAPIIYGSDLPQHMHLTRQDYRNEEGQFFQVFGNVDYTKFKLFLLSLLWRASISTNETFKEVNLGAYHEEVLRRMIYCGDAGNARDYPISFSTYAAEDIGKDIILAPRRSKIGHSTVYILTITGMFYAFHIINGKPIDLNLEENTLKPDGTFTILHTKREEAMKYLLRFSGAEKYIKPASI